MGETKTRDEIEESDKEAYSKMSKEGERMNDDIARKKASENNYDPDGMPDFSWKTWFTGLGRAKITDIRKIDEVNEYGYIKYVFDIDVNGMEETDGFLVVRHREGRFTDQSQLARLLEYKDIKPDEGLHHRLRGETIPVRIDGFGLPSDDKNSIYWEPHIPSKFNRFGRLSHNIGTIYRYLGFEGEVRTNTINYGKSMILATLISLFTIIIETGFRFDSYLVFLSVLVAFLSLFITAHFERILEYLNEKRIEMYSEETIDY